MKQFFLSLMFGLLLLVPNIQAQTDTLTVAEGTATSVYIPVYGSYMERYLHSQMIYPASMLEDMIGATISSISFYTSSPSVNKSWRSKMRVGLASTTATTFTSTPAPFLTDATQTVFIDSFDIVSGVMSIVFDTGFVYTGGNLLIDIATDQTVSYYSAATFKCMTTTNYPSMKGYNSTSVANISNQTTYNKLPTITFVYSGGATCVSPYSVTVDSIGLETAQMVIYPRAGQTQWEYLLAEDGADTTGGSWTSTTDTVVSLIGLVENTPYVVYVRTLCGTDVSNVKAASFHTNCLPISSVPVTWDFESHLTGTNPYYQPACWDRITTSTTPYVYTTSTSAMSGSHMLYFTISYPYPIAVLPEINVTALPMNTLQLSLHAKTTTQDHVCGIEVGMMVEDNNEWTFVPFDTISGITSSYKSEPYTVLLDQYTGTSNRLAFRMLDPTNSSTVLCVDDVTLDTIPPCAKVQHLIVQDLYEQTATLAWHGVSNAYVVRYRTSDYPYWTETMVTTPFITLSGLNSNTTYYFQVAPDCDVITEDMYRQITFVTPCGPMALPYLVNFDDATYDECWTVAARGVVQAPYSSAVYYPQVGVSSSNAHSGTKFLQVGAHQGSSLVVASPKLAPAIETVTMNLYARRQSSFFYSYEFGDLVVGLMTDLTDTLTFIPVDTISVTGTSYASYDVNFSQYPYTGTGYYVAFRYVGFGDPDSVDIGCLFIDDVLFNPISTCSAPTSVSVSNVTQTTAEVSWSGSATSYHVYYKPTSMETYEAMPVTTANSMTIMGLQAATHYHYYVAAVCADGSESPSAVGELVTECGTIYTYPYMQNFDTYDQAMMPECWMKIGGLSESGYTYPLTISNASYATYANSAPTALIFVSSATNHATAILPPFSDDLQHLRLSFSARPEGTPSGTFKIGYITDPTDSTTFEPVLTIATANLTNLNYQNYLVDFSNVSSPDTAYIAFRYECESDYAFYLDDVMVEQIPDCAPPIQLTSTAVLSNSANLSWLTAAPHVELFYKAASDTDYYSQTASLDNDGVFMLDELLPNTTYLWFVSFFCEGEYVYSDTVSFTTDCAGITALPVTWGFESAGNTGPANYPLPICWHRTHSDYPYSYQATLFNYAHTGDRCLNFPTSTGNLCTTLPALDTSAFSLDTLQLTFYARTHAANTPYTLEVGVMQDPMNPTTFVPVQNVVVTTNVYQPLPFRVNFDQYQGDGYYVAFRCQQASPGNVYVDDVTLKVKPDCDPILSISVDDVTMTTAEVSWAPTDASTGFVVNYKPSSDTSWTTLMVPDTFVNLVDLLSATQYDVKVVPDCDDDVLELSTTFTTRCEPIATFPYAESFESGTFGCWYDSTAVANGSMWRVCAFNCNAQISQQGTYHAFLSSSYNNTHSAVFLISPVFDLTTVGTPTLTFFYDALGYSVYTDSLSVYYRTSPTSPWHWLAGYEDHDDVVVQWTADTLELPSPTATYQVAFLGSSSSGDGVYIDNITLYDNIPVIQPEVATYAATDITINTATLHGEVLSAGNQAILDQGFAWKAEADQTYNLESATGILLTHNLQGLTPSTSYTYHAFVTTEVGTVTGQEMTFVTADPPTCPAPTDLTAVLGESHTTVILNWQQEPNTANEWQVNYRQTTEDTWSTVTANATTYTLTDLVANVTYEFKVEAHCTNGLTSDASNTVSIQTDDVGVQSWLEKSVTLYPNPATEMIAIAVSDANIMITDVEVYNVYGQVVETFHGTSLQGRATINVSGLADGMYYVRVTTDNGVVTKNFVKR